MKLFPKAKVLTAALDLGAPVRPVTPSSSVTFDKEFTLPVLRKKFLPTEFTFEASKFRFVDKSHGLVVLLRGARSHHTHHRFETFTTELAKLAE